MVLDTSILVSYLRAGAYADFILGRVKMDSVLLPGVVLAELYAGALSREDRNDVEDFRRAMSPHVFGVDSRDWILSGRCLSAYAMRWGKIRPRDHLAEVVIAVCSARRNADLVTENQAHMLRWSWILKRQGHRLNVLKPPASQ